MAHRPTVRSVLPERKVVIDGGRWLRRRYPMYGFAEWDVTKARARIEAYEASHRTTLSFTGWLARCVAIAVSEDIDAQAIRDWRGRLVTFPGVDVLIMVESVGSSGPLVVGHVARNAAAKTVRELTCEIREAQQRGVGSQTGRLLQRAGRLPGVVRWAGFGLIKRSPRLFVRLGGTVAISSIGMFGGVRWGVAPLHHTIGVTIGAIEVRDGRHHLALTLGMDHDIVDGGPAARLASRLRELVETAAGLPASGAAEDATKPDVGPTGSNRSPLPATASRR